MKKALAAVVVICMVFGMLPAISFAADTTVSAARTAYFNSSGKEWQSTDTSTGGDNVLVSTGATGWAGASSFTDTDGTVTTQTNLAGTNFGSARHALIAFTIPAGFDPDNTAKVTLSMKVKNVKQVTSGARLSVYGNSIDGTWSVNGNTTSDFGVSGSTSGLSSLTLLGLTDAIQTGNQTDESTSNETITLSSQKLTSYVCQMAKEGKTEVTFRLAAPLGGIRIYDTTTSTPPTLTIEEGKVTTVTVRTVYKDGENTVSSSEETVSNITAGSTYTYSGTPAYSQTVDGVTYTYSAENSTLSTVAAEDGSGLIVLVYNKYDESNTFEGYEIDDEGAWCWFADPRSISYKNDAGTLDFSIIGYIDVHGSIKATQINHLTDEVNEVLIRSNIQPDDHNNPTFLVLPDERIVVFYSRHTDEACFWYRVTKEKGDLTTLGEEKCLNTSANTTYPSPFLMENDPDHIYLMWRGINWHPTIAKLSIPDENGNTAFTYGPFQMVQSTGDSSNIRPYAKYSSNGVDKLYVTYTTGHPDNEQPNWVYFNQIDIATMTLEDINGNTMSTIASGPLSVNKTDTTQTNIVDTAPGNMRDWVWQVAEGDDGNPVIAMVRINGGKTSHDYYYVKWNGTGWVKTFLSNGGGHFHQSAGLEMCYSGGMAIDPDNTSIIYCSVPVEGVFGKVYEIIKYTMSTDGTEVLSTEQITKNSKKNNVRPFVIPNSEGRDIRLIWMHGDYYDWIVSNAYTTQGYCTAVMSEKPLPEKTINLTDTIAAEDYSSIGGAFVSTVETGNIVEANVTGSFTVSADIYLEGGYEGKLLDMGAVQVAVKTVSTQYGATATGDRARVVVTVNGNEYTTSNVYGSSDCWTSYSRSTGGNYGVENYGGYINHTITYDGNYLTLYREGLIDIKIPAAGLALENVTVGGFEGLADNVKAYNRVLNRDEIRALADNDQAVRIPENTGSVEITKNYVDIDGTAIDTVTQTLPAGTDIYNFTPEETIKTENAEYALDLWSGSGNEYTAVYYKTKEYGENLISGLDALTNAADGGKLGWAEVEALTVNPNAKDGEKYVHLTGTSTGGYGANTMRTFVSIEGGKTYYVTNTIYNNTGAATVNESTAGMSAIIATGDAVYGTFKGLTIYSDVEYGGVTSWHSGNSDATLVGSATSRQDITTMPGENKIEYILTTPNEAKNIMLSYGAWGNTELYYGDFAVREIKDVETVTVTVDDKAVKTYGTIALGNETPTGGYALPENVIGYSVVSGSETKFVPAGILKVTDGDVITTVNINASMVTGAQVRYGGGLDEQGKVSAGNGLRFVAQVDRSNIGTEVTGYGMRIKAENSESYIDVPADKFQKGDTIFTVAITNMAQGNYNRRFTATPYVKVKYSDNTTATIYGTNGVERSIYQVAAGLLKTGSNGLENNNDDYGVGSQSGLYEVLNAYVNMVGIRLTMDKEGNFTARKDGNGAYTGDIFFDVTRKINSDGSYTVTVTPITENFNNKVTIMSYWEEFIRINNNHKKVLANITDPKINSDGSVTFTFTVPAA